MHIKKKSNRRRSKSYNKKSTRNIRRHLHNKTYKGGMFGLNKNDELESCKITLDACKSDLVTLADNHEDEIIMLERAIKGLKILHKHVQGGLEEVYDAYKVLCEKYNEDNLYKEMLFIKLPVTNYDLYYPKREE